MLPEMSDEDGDAPKWFRTAQAGMYRAETFIRYAENPVATYDEWRVNIEGDDLSDPLLFIRACMELRDATTDKKGLNRKEGFITHLPVEVDQSNSVIQHLALFYGDASLARCATWLLSLTSIHG